MSPPGKKWQVYKAYLVIDLDLHTQERTPNFKCDPTKILTDFKDETKQTCRPWPYHTIEYIAYSVQVPPENARGAKIICLYKYMI